MSRSLLPALLLSLGLAFDASAALIYDNGADTLVNSYPISIAAGSSTAISNQFTLSSAATLTSATFSNWMNTAQLNGGAADAAISVDWAITTAAFGGSVLAQGNDVALSSTLVTSFDFFGSGFDDTNVFDASFSLGGIALAAGTYWLQLSDEVLNTGNIGYWGVSASTIDAYEKIDSNAPVLLKNVNGQANDRSNAFQIYGDVAGASPVPEPATLALLGLGLAGLFQVRRKRF